MSKVIQGTIDSFDKNLGTGYILLSTTKEERVKISKKHLKTLGLGLLEKGVPVYAKVDLKKKNGRTTKELLLLDVLIEEEILKDLREKTLLHFIREKGTGLYTVSEITKITNLEKIGLNSIFTKLRDSKELTFSITGPGEIRVDSIKGQVEQNKKRKNIEIEPEENQFAGLVKLRETLSEELKFEFDRCMGDTKLANKLTDMTRTEIIEFLTERAQFFKKDRLNEIQEVKESREMLKIAKQSAKQKYSREEHERWVKEREKEELERKKTLVKPKKTKKTPPEEDRILIAKKKAAKKIAAEKKSVKKFVPEGEKLKQIIKNKNHNIQFYKVGDVFLGTVVSIKEWGIFVRIGFGDQTIDGLISASNIISKNKNKVNKGKKLEVKIVAIDYKKAQIDLEINSSRKKKSPAKKTSSTRKETKKYVPPLPIQMKSLFNKVTEEGGKENIELFAELVLEASKIIPNEWCVTRPAGRKKIRLNNGGIEGAYLEEEGIMVVVLNTSSSILLKRLIKLHVKKGLHRGAYKKIPEAVPLYLEHQSARKYRKTLKKQYLLFLDKAVETGKNPWKKHHSQDVVDELVKHTKIKIKKPGYL